MDNPVKLAIVGLGGYAGQMTDLVLKCMSAANPPVKLLAVCEPDEAKIAVRREKLDSAGVRILRDYQQILTSAAEAVWLPLPIDLHRSYTDAALAADKAVLCEKPMAGCVQDADAMIAARDRHKRPVAIGFHDLFAPSNWRMKDELLAGAIGKVHTATVLACWPRDSSYFARSGWAGRISRNRVWVLDSPANNAMAHYIQLPLFWLGATRTTAAEPSRIEAELYRANAIENYDVCCLRAAAGDATLLVYYTHVCEPTIGPIIELHGEKGMARYADNQLEIHSGGQVRTWPVGDCRPSMIEHFAKLVRAEDEPRVATMEMARAHSLLISGASEAAAIQPIPADLMRAIPMNGGATLLTIDGLPEVLRQCVTRRVMLHESGLVKWSRPAGAMDLRGYRVFKGTKGDG